MKVSKQDAVRYIAEAGIIAALYVALTYVAGLMGLAYGPVQFRISEVLTLLPVFTPAAVPGLVIGCAISNIASTVGIIDVVFGTLATLLAAICTRALRNVCVKGIPVLSTLPPVVFNGIIIAFEIWFMGDRSPALFWGSCWTIALGEAVVCIILGIPFMAVIKKTRIFSSAAKKHPESADEGAAGSKETKQNECIET